MSFDQQSDQVGFDPYVSSRKVRAAKIMAIDGPTCVRVAPLNKPIYYVNAGKPQPAPGWYVLCYSDGYISFCPPDSFGQGYARDLTS